MTLKNPRLFLLPLIFGIILLIRKIVLWLLK